MVTVGDHAPNFELRDQNGEPVALTDYAGQTVVLYFYPEAKTGGCTREARAFQEAIEGFQSRDVAVIGVSTDSVDLLAEFAEEEGLEFPLLADEDGSVASSFGSLRESGRANRDTFVIGPDGIIQATYHSVTPDEHPTSLLRDIDELTTA